MVVRINSVKGGNNNMVLMFDKYYLATWPSHTHICADTHIVRSMILKGYIA